MSKSDSQNYWNWVGNTIGLPIISAFAIWIALKLSNNYSFSTNFGSGELISISAMMFVVLYQEISITPTDNRTPFSIFLHGFSSAIIAGLWILYGIVKYYSHINQNSTSKDVQENLGIIALASLIILVGIGITCLIQKSKLKS